MEGYSRPKNGLSWEDYLASEKEYIVGRVYHRKQQVNLIILGLTLIIHPLTLTLFLSFLSFIFHPPSSNLLSSNL